MRGRNFKTLRAAADAIVQLNLEAERRQAAGEAIRAATSRWRAARRSLWAMAVARQTYGLPAWPQMQQLGDVSPADYLQ